MEFFLFFPVVLVLFRALLLFIESLQWSFLNSSLCRLFCGQQGSCEPVCSQCPVEARRWSLLTVDITSTEFKDFLFLCFSQMGSMVTKKRKSEASDGSSTAKRRSQSN